MDRNIITGVVLTFNSELTIGNTLKSLEKIAGRLIVLDSGSTDSTLQIVRDFNAEIHRQPFAGYAAQRKSAYALVETEWIFALDADETISSSLAHEINALSLKDFSSESNNSESNNKEADNKEADNREVTGIRVPILNFFNKRPLCYGGMYPDYHLRLFKKECSHVEENRVHEGIKTSGRILDLSNPVLHYPYRDLAHLAEKMISYAVLASEQLYEDNRKMRASWFNIFFRPAWSFFNKFFLRMGFLDGFNGLVYHIFHASYVFMKYFMLRERFEKAAAEKAVTDSAGQESGQ